MGDKMAVGTLWYAQQAVCKILQGALLTNESPDTLRKFNLPFSTTKNSLGLPSLWVDIKYQEILKKEPFLL